jgi:hypothetical protein
MVHLVLMISFQVDLHNPRPFIIITIIIIIIIIIIMYHLLFNLDE